MADKNDDDKNIVNVVNVIIDVVVAIAVSGNGKNRPTPVTK